MTGRTGIDSGLSHLRIVEVQPVLVQLPDDIVSFLPCFRRLETQLCQDIGPIEEHVEVLGLGYGVHAILIAVGRNRPGPEPLLDLGIIGKLRQIDDRVTNCELDRKVRIDAGCYIGSLAGSGR